jgi:hypothetical protein
VRSRLLLALAAAVTLVALAEPSASAARSAGAGSQSAALCPGGTLLTAVSAQRLPAGSMAYTYELPDGTSFENVAPPAGFNFATASNALLTELNLPQRPSGAAARKAWEAQVAPFGKFGISRAEEFCERAPAEQEPATAGQPAVGMVALPSVGHAGHTFWSGYELRSGPYQKAVGHFRQPSVSVSSRAISSWVGLNGTGSGGRLIQAGAGNGYGNYGGALFWELYCSAGSRSGCNSAQISSRYYASPGNTVSVSVSYNPKTLMSYYAVAINGVERINVEYKMRSGSNSGHVADFITERTLGDVIPTFTSIPFSASRTYKVWNSNTSVPFGSQGYFAYEMTNNGSYYAPSCSASSHILIYPNKVSSGGFVNNFCRGA